MRAGLSERLPRDCHVFGNVMDTFGDGDTAMERFSQLESYQDKLDLASELPLFSTAYCHRHGRRCPIETGAAARVGGVPCQDCSSAGKQLFENGSNYPTTLGFSYKCSMANTPLPVIECVPNLPRHAPLDAFQHDNFEWILDRTLLPEQFGFENIARPRQGA